MYRRERDPFFNNFGKNLSILHEITKDIDRFLHEPQQTIERLWQNSPHSEDFELLDKGEHFELIAVVPGLKDKDLQINANTERITLTGKQNIDVPEGYNVQRQERSPMNFSRTYQFPERVDVENITAQLKDGILVVKLLKTPDTKPKEIKIQVPTR